MDLVWQLVLLGQVCEFGFCIRHIILLKQFPPYLHEHGLIRMFHRQAILRLLLLFKRYLDSFLAPLLVIWWATFWHALKSCLVVDRLLGGHFLQLWIRFAINFQCFEVIFEWRQRHVLDSLLVNLYLQFGLLIITFLPRDYLVRLIVLGWLVLFRLLVNVWVWTCVIPIIFILIALVFLGILKVLAVCFLLILMKLCIFFTHRSLMNIILVDFVLIVTSLGWFRSLPVLGSVEV